MLKPHLRMGEATQRQRSMRMVNELVCIYLHKINATMVSNECVISKYNAIQYNTIKYNEIQHHTLQYNKMQYNTIQYNTMHYNTNTNSFIVALTP